MSTTTAGVPAYHFRRDVSGERYNGLVTALLERSESFGLVWRKQPKFEHTAEQVAVDLADHCIKERLTYRWPGTRLIGHKATIRLYRSGQSALPILLRPGSLFSWRSPHYPEDLCFFDASGAPCFASVAHESDAWVLSGSLASLLGQMLKLERVKLEGEDADLVRGVA